ncbi:MAG: cytochrome c biogenesis protein CcdA [Rhodothermia bacterium]|nr:MAG: cytochrome c biogenesis protein CcdA [Rhodothermia bacterium]
MSNRKSSFLALLFVLALNPVTTAFGQFDQTITVTDLVAWTTSVNPKTVVPGGRVLVQFDVEISGDWKMYALDESLPPQESVLSRPYGVEIEWVDLPDNVTNSGSRYQAEPEVGYDPTFDISLKYFHESARFAEALIVSPEASAESVTVGADLRYQICSDDLGICLRPTKVNLTAQFEIDPDCEGEDCTATETSLSSLIPGEADQDVTGGPLISATTDFDASRSSGFWGFLLLALGAGLASLLTPCVFPMIPLTISYFTKHSENRLIAVRMASVFGGSIVVTFTVIGIVAALVVGAAGAQRIAANPWVNLFIAVVLVGFALGLLGLYELRLPSRLVNFFDSRGNERSGIGGVIFIGLTLTLVSFSCTAPFVGGLLAAASGGTWMYPLFGMIVYSGAFALPFILLAIFPNALNSLPNSGSWMNAIKVVLGFVELAAAVKFLSNSDLLWGWGLISRPLGIAFIVVVFFLTGLYLLGRLRLRYEPTVETVGVGRVLGSMFFFVSALYMLPGLLGAPLNKLDAYLPPRQGTDVSMLSLFQSSDTRVSASSDDGWFIDDIEGAFGEAVDRGRPVLVDFTGYTCTNCREMEANVFIRKPITDRFESGYVLLRLYTDGLEHGEEFARYQLQLTGTVALPTYAVVEPVERRVLAKRSGVMDLTEFAAFLDTGIISYQSLMSRNQKITTSVDR